MQTSSPARHHTPLPPPQEPYCDAFCADDAPPLSEEELVTVLEDGRQVRMADSPISFQKHCRVDFCLQTHRERVR